MSLGRKRKHTPVEDLEMHNELKELEKPICDPEKVWLSLEYPDSVRGSREKLCSLLCALRSDKTHIHLGMHEIEWTLIARINCHDSDPSMPCVPIDSTTQECNGTSSEETVSCTTENMLNKSTQTTPLHTYFAITAPVFCSTIPLDLVSPKNQHCVLSDTETLLAVMRYKFRCNNKRPEKPGLIAERINSLIKDTLLDDPTNYRVYVFKQEEGSDHDYHGISPSPSVNFDPCQYKGKKVHRGVHDNLIDPFDIDPDPLDIDPDPLGIDPDPLDIDPDPLGIDPDPLGIDPDPLDIDPDPLGIDPDPLDIDPDPLDIDPDPLGIDPDPLDIDPDPFHIDPDPFDDLDQGSQKRAKTVPESPADKIL